jgi:hypothetical protein
MQIQQNFFTNFFNLLIYPPPKFNTLFFFYKCLCFYFSVPLFSTRKETDELNCFYSRCIDLFMHAPQSLYDPPRSLRFWNTCNLFFPWLTLVLGDKVGFVSEGEDESDCVSVCAVVALGASVNDGAAIES